MPKQSSSPAILIRHASLKYHNTTVFVDLDFTVPAGKFTCLLGPSGVGKSTLLQMIAKIIDTQDCTCNATITCSNHTNLAEQIAYMSQADSLLPWLTTLQNTLLGYRLRGNVTPEKKQHAQDLLEKIGLGKVMHKKPRHLSGGMRQRVALARTLLEDKPIVLMDEPFSALDAITRLHLQNLAAELLCDKTVLLVTHDPLEALRLGHEIYVMAGQPATLGEPIIPLGDPPRKTTDFELLKLQGELLQRLEQAKEII